MFGVGFDAPSWELARSAGTILLLSGVIKLMDDFLDLRYDVFTGAQSLAVRLGEGTLPYALLGFAFAVMLDSPLAVSIMIGAYAVGMAGDWERQLPSGLAGYQESLLVVVVAFLFLPWSTVLWALAANLVVQAVDDIYDLDTDRSSGNPNLARKFGIVECKMLGVAALIVAALLNPLATVLTFVSIPLALWVSDAARKAVGQSPGVAGAMMDVWLYHPGTFLVIAFVAFFGGYATGRRHGKREGFGEGVRYAPLEMRRITWERGHCVICGLQSADGRARSWIHAELKEEGANKERIVSSSDPPSAD